MLENVFEAIHAERKMSLNHWRYRLLHWACCVDTEGIYHTADGRIQGTPLNQCLYTHYCPLFHLTNLIALVAPFILLGKLVWALGVVGYHVFLHIKSGIKKTHALYRKWRPKNDDQDNIIIEQYREKLHQKELRSIPRLLVRLAREHECFLTDFDYFYNRITSCYDHFDHFESNRIAFATKEEIKKIWDVVAPKVKAALDAQKIRQEKMRKTIVFWVNFSRIFIKGILNLFYLALFVGVVYLMVVYGWPLCKIIGEGIVWLVTGLISLDWIGCLTGFGAFILRVAIGFATVGGVIWLIYKFVPVHLLWEKTCPPFVAVGDAIVAVCRYIKNVVVGVCEFVEMFYEENCPPITIVDDAEATIAEEIK